MEAENLEQFRRLVKLILDGVFPILTGKWYTISQVLAISEIIDIQSEIPICWFINTLLHRSINSIDMENPRIKALYESYDKIEEAKQKRIK
jgi:hypothetical protein